MSTQLYSTARVDEGNLQHPLLLKLHTLRKKPLHFSDAFSTLVRALQAKDHLLYRHSTRVMYFTLQFSRVLNLPPGIVSIFTLGALFHDLGKISLSDKLLHKPSGLTVQEFTRIKEHPLRGALILNSMALFQQAVSIVHCHHEWWNGTGYPNGLCGEAIPLGARIVALADAYEVMTSTSRPYRQPFTHLEALAELRRCAGTQFDPTLVSLFCTACNPSRLRSEEGVFTIMSETAPEYPENHSARTVF